MIIRLPWFRKSDTEIVAHTLAGTIRIKKTAPPFYLRLTSPSIGYSVLFNKKRITWTTDFKEADRTASQFIRDTMTIRSRANVLPR